MTEHGEGHGEEQGEEPKGTVDLASVLYVVGGIPFMIAFLVILFLLVDYFDGKNIMIPA